MLLPLLLLQLLLLLQRLSRFMIDAPLSFLDRFLLEVGNEVTKDLEHLVLVDLALVVRAGLEVMFHNVDQRRCITVVAPIYDLTPRLG